MSSSLLKILWIKNLQVLFNEIWNSIIVSYFFKQETFDSTSEELCFDLMSCSSSDSISTSSSESTDSDIADTKVADYEELKKKLRNCQDEMYKLQAANSDLTQVNKRWHKYNSDMQIFIDRLQSTIRDQQEQINSIGEQQSYKMKNEDDNITDDFCDKLACRKLREEVIKLKEEAEHLKFQVRAHKDDWEAEKLEKQEALNERDALQTRLNDVLRDICNLNRSQNEEASRRYQGCPCCRHWERNNSDFNNPMNTAGYNQAVLCTSSRQPSHHPGRYYFTDENIECDSNILHTQKLNTNNLIENDERKNYIRKLSTTSDDRSIEDNAACSIGLLSSREDTFINNTIPTSSNITLSSRSNSPISHHQTHRKQGTTLAMGIKTGGNGATLTSYVRLPVVKSNSAPEGCLAGPSNVRLNSISLSVVPGNSGVAATSTIMQSSTLNPPRSLPSLINHSNDDENNDNINVQNDNINCPRCHEVFTSSNHLDFIDHFEQCQRNSE